MTENKPMRLKESVKAQTIRDTITVLEKIWNAGCDEYDFQLRDPFRDLGEFIPEDPIEESEDGLNAPPPVWRHGEAMKILMSINKGQANVSRFMFLTGLSASEIAGIRELDIRGQTLLIRNFVPRGKKPKKKGKNKYRRRAIKITKAIRECLDVAIEKMVNRNAEEGKEEYLFLSVEGKHFSCSIYYEYWGTAVKRAGLDYKKPYSTRHTFVAWGLALGKTPSQMVDMMGHGSKKMVYEVYGDWAEGLDMDVADIRRFMGDDF